MREERLQVQRRQRVARRERREAGRPRCRAPSGEKMLIDWKYVGCDSPRSKSAVGCSAPGSSTRRSGRDADVVADQRRDRARRVAVPLVDLVEEAAGSTGPDLRPAGPTRMPLASTPIMLATFGSAGSAAPGPRAAASRSPRALRDRRRPSRRGRRRG